MKLNKIEESVEYYVFTSTESPEAFTVDVENNKFTEILLPDIKLLRDDYLFVYVNDLRAHPVNDFTMDGRVLEFIRPVSMEHTITVKMYTKHDVLKDVLEV